MIRIKNLMNKRNKILFLRIFQLLFVLLGLGSTFYITRILLFSQTCMTVSQVQNDNRCLYVLSNNVYEKGTRSSPHQGHACGSDITSAIASVPFHTNNPAVYLSPNFRAPICSVNPTGTPVPTSPVSTPTPINNPSPTVKITPTNAPTATPAPTRAPTPAFTADVILQMKLRLQGVLAMPKANQDVIDVKILLIGKSGKKSCSPASFEADADGIWSGGVGKWEESTNCSLPDTAEEYTLFVKGAKHIQKKICELKPIETTKGVYRCSMGTIKLVKGVNNIDLSEIYLLVGDLPNQDGVVNSYDTSLVRNNLGSTDEQMLSLCDLNLDGICDTQDYSLLLSALLTRYDEE